MSSADKLPRATHRTHSEDQRNSSSHDCYRSLPRRSCGVTIERAHQGSLIAGNGAKSCGLLHTTSWRSARSLPPSWKRKSDDISAKSKAKTESGGKTFLIKVGVLVDAFLKIGVLVAAILKHAACRGGASFDQQTDRLIDWLSNKN